MATIRTAIEVDRPATKLWEVLLDFPAYSRWNPFIVNISGAPAVGNRLEVLLQTAPGKQMRFRPRVLKADLHREFLWRGHFLFPGLFDGEHRFALEPLGSNGTRFVHEEHFQGILLPLLKPLLAKTRTNFEAMNQAFKKEVESR